MWSTLASAAGLARPKKKFHFNVTFCLQDLRHCTYVSGLMFAKMRLKSGGSFIIHSDRKEVRNHCVLWNQQFEFPCKMYASPNTGELEACTCKISIRREIRGGKSYEKLGYVKINLAEYAGAGERERKYLLESYNERLHKPDNSILKVKVSLRQTSGDVLFKAPRAPVWELEDEGIQPDITSDKGRSSSDNRTSMTSTASTFSYASGSGQQSGSGSLQDMRRRSSTLPSESRKSCSAGSLRTESISESSLEESTSERNNVDEQNSSSTPSNRSSGKESSSTPKSEGRTPQNLSPKLTSETHGRSSSLGGGGIGAGDTLRPLELTATNLSTLPGGSPRQHKRQPSEPVVMTTSNYSPLRVHKRQQSLLSGNSSMSTSAYSTLSERSMAGFEDDTGSTRSRLSLVPPSSRVEQSRFDPESVVDRLLQGLDFSKREEEEGAGGGLQIYVDKMLGTVHLAGPDLDRTNRNLQPIDVTHRTSAGSPKPRHKRGSSTVSVQTTSSKDSTSTVTSSNSAKASTISLR